MSHAYACMSHSNNSDLVLQVNMALAMARGYNGHELIDT